MAIRRPCEVPGLAFYDINNDLLRSMNTGNYGSTARNKPHLGREISRRRDFYQVRTLRAAVLSHHPSPLSSPETHAMLYAEWMELCGTKISLLVGCDGLALLFLLREVVRSELLELRLATGIMQQITASCDRASKYADDCTVMRIARTPVCPGFGGYVLSSLSLRLA
jgi:hypothetical protein